MEKVKALLQNRPELVQATLTHLENLMDETSQDMAKTPVKAGPGPQGSPSQGSLGGHEEGTSPLSEDVPVCYTSIEELSVKLLKQILFQCEPIAFGPFAIRALAKRGAREVAKQNLTQLIEYVTGVEPSVTINGEERKFTNLIQRLVDLSNGRGNLGRSLQLPPDWARQGFYEITDVNPLTVKNKAGLEVQVADEILPGDIEKRTFYVSTNWSEKRATLEAEGVFLNQTLYVLFAPAHFNKKKEHKKEQADKENESGKKDEAGRKRHKPHDKEEKSAARARTEGASELGVAPPMPVTRS